MVASKLLQVLQSQEKYKFLGSAGWQADLGLAS